MAVDAKNEVHVHVVAFPGTNAVDYLQEVAIPVLVVNDSSARIVVDRIVLRFHPEWASAAYDATHEEICSEFSIDARSHEDRKVSVIAKPTLFGPSNYFNVQVVYHRHDAPGDLLSAVCPTSHYVILNPPTGAKSQAFISFKYPDDADLAEILRKIAQRVGFSPYIAPADARPGTYIWKRKIAPAIRKSRCVFVIWTNFTRFGSGVEKEIRIARRAHVKVILLVEKGAAVPEGYKSMRREIMWFDRASAPVEFSRTVVASRRLGLRPSGRLGTGKSLPQSGDA